jgi:hypothetical protein
MTCSPVVDASGVSGPLDRRPGTSSSAASRRTMGQGYGADSAKVDGVRAPVSPDGDMTHGSGRLVPGTTLGQAATG